MNPSPLTRFLAPPPPLNSETHRTPAGNSLPTNFDLALRSSVILNWIKTQPELGHFTMLEIWQALCTELEEPLKKLRTQLILVQDAFDTHPLQNKEMHLSIGLHEAIPVDLIGSCSSIELQCYESGTSTEFAGVQSMLVRWPLSLIDTQSFQKKIQLLRLVARTGCQIGIAVPMLQHDTLARIPDIVEMVRSPIDFINLRTPGGCLGYDHNLLKHLDFHLAQTVSEASAFIQQNASQACQIHLDDAWQDGCAAGLATLMGVERIYLDRMVQHTDNANATENNQQDMLPPAERLARAFSYSTFAEEERTPLSTQIAQKVKRLTSFIHSIYACRLLT